MLILNRHPDHRAELDPADAAMLGEAATEAAAGFFLAREDYRPTPIRALPALAAALGVGEVHVKDEGQRLGLGSFKALGGAHAVARLVLDQASREVGRPLGFDDLGCAEVRAVAARMTFCCATAGNHGRSVAHGAQRVGARAVIFVPEGVAEARIAALARLDAEIILGEGGYDDCVVQVVRAAAENGWTVVSDTAWPGYERIPGLVMQGYSLIVREALEALSEPPTHVFVQVGVGGLAGALAARLALIFGDRRPTLVSVEPERAACMLESARQGEATRIAPQPPTVMSMLACQQPSLSAWRILSRAADAFMTVSDEDAVAAVRRLAQPLGVDPPMVASESGAAGLAGLMQAAADPEARAAIGLSAASRVFIVGSETANDPARWREITGP